MPCDTITSTTVALQKADKELLKKGLKTDGWSVWESGGIIYANKFEAGRFYSAEYDGSRISTNQSGKNHDDAVNSIKRSYSRAVVEATTRRYGWQTVRTEGDKYTVRKRV